ncbi:MAG TPA: tRNA uridine-5-carboxymethylaminomethyl(34) synthesis GTPase MnmE [Thermovirgaceae bacterium]|nr:tRNA uridine-5-carboxymethylaminomethyl(34) synthesis GTPase MnmE [Thermovirgaceae bacterium]
MGEGPAFLRKDIIAAISTAWGESGIAIVRLSGSGSRDLVDSIFKGGGGLGPSPPRYMKHGFIHDADGDPIDEVLAVWFKKPYSYTGEEAAEIHCHGGTVAARKCLELCLCGGARMARPGEFTRLAFLNGRIDLAEAESVLGVIRACSDGALKAAAKCLQGRLSDRLRSILDELADLSAAAEAFIDHPDEDIPEVSAPDYLRRLSKVAWRMRDLLSAARAGRFLREGIGVAISGRPNVGKSSLMNAFLEESRSIVTSMPGTTRDVIEEVISHKGIPLRLTDTAGIRDPRDLAEEEGVRRSLEAIKEADIRVWVIDGSEPITDDDRRIAASLLGSCCVIAVNKSDLPLSVDLEEVKDLLPGREVRVVSAVTGQGLDELKDLIVLSVSGSTTVDEDVNTTERQVEEIREALALVEEAEGAFASDIGLDAALDLLAGSRECLSRILGLSTDEDLLDRIFSNFCIGK